jgi:hypothetical protein
MSRAFLKEDAQAPQEGPRFVSRQGAANEGFGNAANELRVELLALPEITRVSSVPLSETIMAQSPANGDDRVELAHDPHRIRRSSPFLPISHMGFRETSRSIVASPLSHGAQFALLEGALAHRHHKAATRGLARLLSLGRIDRVIVLSSRHNPAIA